MAPEALSLTATAARASLDPALAQGAQPRAVAAHVSSIGPAKRIYVVFRQIKADKQPGVLYRAYLDLPEKPNAQQLADHYVGTINFFNFVPHRTGHAAPAPHAAARGKERFLSFDITSKIRALHFSRVLREKPVITIIPAGKPAENANPVIGKVELVVQ